MTSPMLTDKTIGSITNERVVAVEDFDNVIIGTDDTRRICGAFLAAQDRDALTDAVIGATAGEFNSEMLRRAAARGIIDALLGPEVKA